MVADQITDLEQLAALYGTPNDASTRKECSRVHPLYRRLIDASPFVVLATTGPGGLRVNGRAQLSVETALLARFEMQGQRPRCVIVVAVETVFFQCARAIKRAQLWDPASHVARESLPSPGTILAELSRDAVDGTAYDRDLQARQAATLY